MLQQTAVKQLKNSFRALNESLKVLSVEKSSPNRNFFQNVDSFDKRTYPFLLLLFYAVEVGLKTQMLEQKRTIPSEKDEDSGFYSHDLNTLISQVDITKKALFASNFDLIFPNRSSRNSTKHISLKDLHSAFRYGREINKSLLKTFYENANFHLKSLQKILNIE